MKKYIALVMALSIFAINAGCSTTKAPAPKPDTQNETTTPETDNTEMKESENTFDYSGALEDVTKGKTITGVNTGEKSSGTAKARFKNGEYTMQATFENLPDPQGTDFYEGWVVRKGFRFSVISTGKAEKVDGKYINNFTSKEDLTDHTFYVLTIEPDDGDPAPAEHILEGTMKK